jgi:hypothetical protein
MKARELTEHAFSQALFEAVRPAMVAQHEFEKAHPGGKYLPDEHEFYLLRVGNRLAVLLSHCEQLDQALVYFSTFRETPTARRAGASRQKYLRYMTENYIVRTQTTEDLVLKLIDAVFHLTNADAQCRHQTIAKNLRVSCTEVPKVLRKLHKRLTDFSEARNIVVHRGGYQEDDLHRMELYAEVEDIYTRTGEPLPTDLAFVPAVRREATRDFVSARRRQYARFNSSIFGLVSEVLDAMLMQFTDEEARVRAVAGVPNKGINLTHAR